MAEDSIVDLEALVARWSEELAIEDELSELGLDDARDAETREDEEWISLAAAEEEAGVSRSTLRAWYRGGRIPSRLAPGPHGLQRLVPRRAVMDRAATSPRTTPTKSTTPAKSGKAGDETEATVPANGDVVRLVEVAIAAARERAELAETRAAEAEAALRAALERAAAAEAELRILRGRGD